MATRLRDRMIAEMELRGLNPQTQKEYMDSMLKFFEFYKDKPPTKIGIEDIKAYQLYLIKVKELAPNSINRHLSAIRFFFQPQRSSEGKCSKRSKKRSTVANLNSWER